MPANEKSTTNNGRDNGPTRVPGDGQTSIHLEMHRKLQHARLGDRDRVSNSVVPVRHVGRGENNQHQFILPEKTNRDHGDDLWRDVRDVLSGGE